MMTQAVASIRMRLGDLPGLSSLSPRQANTPLADITADSRRVTPGALFCARSGGVSHGMDHVEQALAKGAAAILCEPGGEWNEARINGFQQRHDRPIILIEGLARKLGDMAAAFFGDPSAAIKVTGITGTNGKSSCAWFLAQLSGEPCALIGTLGAGFVGQLDEIAHTTPEAIELQRLLAGLRQRGARHIAMEASSHALDQGRVTGVRFDTAVFTNLSRDHLDYHGDMAAYGEAKARLFRCSGVTRAVINLDDPFGVKLAGELAGSVEVVGYELRTNEPSPQPLSLGERGSMEPRIWAEGLRADGQGLSFVVDGDWGRKTIRAPLLGRFNIANLLAVYGALLSQGDALEDLAERTATLQSVPGRMQLLGGGDRPAVVVDYAHTPDALEQALSALREHGDGRLHCLFGCGGDRDPGKRPLMGRIGERLADRLMLTDDNPRSESGEAIIAQIVTGLEHPEQVEIERRRGHAIDRIIAAARPGELVLIAGKGHERYQQIGDLKHPFDDVEEARAALERHFGGGA